MLPKNLGNYEVIEQIGAGGMGEVYRARDARLGREVALKLLPDAFAADPDRLGRFEREARLLAALNHPNIGSIYGLEQHEGRRFLVLELVPGEDLGARIARGAVPLEEALPIARDIAEALEFAHEQGIVHRDLKPANVKITPEGRVKVLDFGLAKALESEEGDARMSQSPTLLASSPTIAGVILGTAAYMSPEQARGKRVDKRSDVFAFGCVLYEMLTGKQAFEGDTISDTLAAVLKTQPEMGALPSNTPHAIRELLQRCLEKDPKLRLRDIGEARIAIDHARHAGPDGAAASGAVSEPASRRPVNLIWGAVTLAVAASAFFGARSMAPKAPEAPLRKLTIDLDETAGSTRDLRVALSPDGRRIAYFLNDHLWIRDLSNLDPELVPDSENAETPFWSPDGTQLGYRIGSTFYRIDAGGGKRTVISATGETFSGGSGAAWTKDGRIIFTTGLAGLLVVPAMGGDPTVLVPLDTTETDLHEASELPGGRGFLFVSHRKEGGPNTIVLFAGGTRRLLLTASDQRLWTPRYASTGHILYRRTPTNAGIWALPFSLDRLEVTGEPFLVAPDGAEPCPGPNGLMVYRHGGDQRQQLAFVTRDGTAERRIGDIFDGVGSAALSPDGKRLAAVVNENNNGDVWVFDLARGTRTRLTFDSGWDVQPRWSPDGRSIYYVTVRDGTIRRRAADGTGAEHLVHKGWGPSISPDGKWMAFDNEVTDQGSNVFLMPLPLDSSMAPTPLVATANDEWAGQISPDGAYLAYVSSESGRNEVYLTRLPDGDGKWQVSAEGGSRPRWDPRGGHLYFTTSTELWEVGVTTRPSLVLGNPHSLFNLEQASVVMGRSSGYDVAPGGGRFVTTYNATADAQRAMLRLTVVENWSSEFTKIAIK
jgi:eukaryotic-like serine/threonine-protein kinase